MPISPTHRWKEIPMKCAIVVSTPFSSCKTQMCAPQHSRCVYIRVEVKGTNYHKKKKKKRK